MSKQAAHILLVDDNDVLREGLQLSLEQLGYSMHAAANGEQALQIFQANQIDVALLDVQMPGMDGVTLCAELRKRHMIPVIFISTLQRQEDQQRLGQLGLIDFLRKPFQVLDISERIQRALQTTPWPA
jgi:two-component system, OmpR family, response regulator ResD